MNPQEFRIALAESSSVMLYTLLCFDVGRQMYPERSFVALSDPERRQVHLKVAAALMDSRQVLSTEPLGFAIGLEETPQTSSDPESRRGYL
jgi:hypothetical protein